MTPFPVPLCPGHCLVCTLYKEPIFSSSFSSFDLSTHTVQSHYAPLITFGSAALRLS